MFGLYKFLNWQSHIESIYEDRTSSVVSVDCHMLLISQKQEPSNLYKMMQMTRALHEIQKPEITVGDEKSAGEESRAVP